VLDPPVFDINGSVRVEEGSRLQIMSTEFTIFGDLTIGNASSLELSPGSSSVTGADNASLFP
jgi:hypothetical protein